MRFENPLRAVLIMLVSSQTVSKLSYKNMPIFLLKVRFESDSKLKNTSVNTSLRMIVNLVTKIEKNTLNFEKE